MSAMRRRVFAATKSGAFWRGAVDGPETGEDVDVDVGIDMFWVGKRGDLREKDGG